MREQGDRKVLCHWKISEKLTDIKKKEDVSEENV